MFGNIHEEAKNIFFLNSYPMKLGDEIVSLWFCTESFMKTPKNFKFPFLWEHIKFQQVPKVSEFKSFKTEKTQNS